MKLSFFACLILLVFVQANINHHEELTLDFVKWLKNDPKFIFISDKGDTVKFIMDSHSLDVSKDHRLVDYHKIAKDTNYYADFLAVDTFPHHEPKFTILFEGCHGELNGKNFHHKYTFKNAELHDVAEFDVKHDNHRYFPHPKKEVKRMWWSSSKGLIKYETRDGLTWQRLE